MRALALVLPLLLAACGPDAPATTDPPGTPPPDATPLDTAGLGPEADGAGSADGAPARPETTTATISVEGTDEPVDLRLVRFDVFDLPFSTYVPADWTDTVLGSGEGAAAFMATGDGPDRAFVSLFVPSEPNREGIVGMARAAVGSRGALVPLDGAEPWVDEGYSFSGAEEAGSVRVGSHAGVPFYVLQVHPLDWGDGFGPRAALVRDRLRWTDDGTGL